MNSRSQSVAVAALLAAVLSACGTTVPMTSQVGNGSPLGDGLAPAQAIDVQAGGETALAPKGEAAQTPDGRAGGATGARTPSSDGASLTTGTGTSGPSGAARVTAPLKVGVAVPDIAAIAAAFGQPGADGTAAPRP